MRRLTLIKGFTFVELMVALLVAAILLTVAIPSFKSFLNRNQLEIVSREIVNALQGAREQAVTLGADMSISQAGNGVSCSHPDGNCPYYQFSYADISFQLDDDSESTSTNFNFKPNGRTDTGILTFVVSHPDVGHEFVIRILPSGRVDVDKEDASG